MRKANCATETPGKTSLATENTESTESTDRIRAGEDGSTTDKALSQTLFRESQQRY